MQVLEKILEEIELEKKRLVFYPDCSSAFSAVQIRTIEKIEQIICKYMSIRKHINDGWVSVEERLPENDGIYIATMDGEIVGQKIPFTGLAEFENGKWVVDEDDYNCVIAWRPLPEPYRPERSERE